MAVVDLLWDLRALWPVLRLPTIKAREDEIADLVTRLAPRLLAEPGCGLLTSAKLVGAIAGAQCSATDVNSPRAVGSTDASRAGC